MPLQVDSGPEPEMYAGPVQPGESRDFEFVLTVDNPGAFEIAAIAEGVADGTRVTGRGVDVLNVGGEPLLLLRLAVDLRHGHPLPRVEEGQRVRVNGTVQNLSLDETIALDPVRFANEGQGLVIGPVALGDLLPAAGDPGIFAPELGPGESADLILDVSTAVLPGIDGNLLVGRESVVLDTLLSGVVVDADGGERELDAAVEVIYELGNGRHQASGRELLRAEVEPVIAPSRIYDFQTFAFMAGGEAMEQLVQGGAEFFIQLPSVIASLPSAAYQIGSAGASYTAGELKTYSTAVQYMWAWADYQTDLYLGMSTETTEEILQEVTDDLMALYGHQVESREQLKGLVDAAVEGMFTQMIDYRQRAYDASSYGFTEELVAVTAEPFNAIGRTLVEEITGTAVIGWLGKTARSTKVAQDLLQARADRALADAARVADATEDVWRSASNPRVSAAPSTMRGLSASAKVTGQQAVRGWAIDTLSDANLRRLTSKGEGLPVIVAIRSRADETLEWMNTSLGITVKPVTFKPKNVDWRDVQFLGYRDGVGYGIGDRGATALVEPISRERVLANLAAANADDLTYTTVLQRHGQRWKEWYGIECPPGPTCTVPADLSSSAVARLKDKAPVVEIGSNGLAVRKGSLEVPSRGHAPEPADNWDTAGAPAVYDQRRFEMRQITDPEGLGREYWETWLEHSDGSMRRISGDIDIVAVTDTSGRTLSGSSAENVALQLGSLVEAQHPWSSTLNFPEARQSFLDAHRWHPDPARRGEPLLLYMNGEARVGWFDPTKTIDPANPLDAILWLDGGAVDVDDVVRYQRELRGTLADPSDAATPAGHTPGGSSVRKALIDADNTDGGSRLATCSIRTARVGAALYRMSDRSQLERRQDDGSFAPVDVDDACEGGEIVVLPDTATLQDVASGTFTIPIIDELLGIDWRNLFMVGDCVVIAPGTAREESACITAHGSLVLDRPLRFDHPALTQVVMVPAAAVPPATPAPVPEQVTTRPAPPTVAPTGAADVMETLSAMPALRPVVESSASPPDAPDTPAGDQAEPNEPQDRDEAAGDRPSDPATSDLTYLLAFVALATLLGLVMLRRRTSAAG